jgi:PAS domain S-box-containing protein
MAHNLASLNGVNLTTPEGLRSILESVSDGLLIVDSVGMVIFANASACTMFRHEDLVGTQLGLPVVPDGGYADIHILRKNSMGWAEMRTEPISWSGMTAHLVSVHDVTERHVYEQRLSLAAKVYESSREGIVITDAEANIILVNATFTRLTGYTADEVIGKNPSILKSDLQDSAFYIAMWDAIKTQGAWQGEVWNRRKDGTIFPELLSISTTAASVVLHSV